MLNYIRIYQGVAKNVESLLSCIQMPKGHNTIFDRKDLNQRMIDAAIRNASVGGYADAVRVANNKNTGCRTAPSGRWCAGIIKKTDVDALQKSLCDSIRRQVKTMKKNNKIPKEGMTIAIDMHLIPRYDEIPDEELTRSRQKKGTMYFERYITAQCVDNKIRINLGAIHLRMLDSVPESLDILIGFIKDAGVKIRLVLLDREFFSIASIKSLQKCNVPFLTPCRNTGNVIAALREFAVKKRNRTSQNILEGTSDMIKYWMIIAKRKNKKGSTDPEAPEKKYIGFATNVPSIDVEQYATRWGIETGYRMIESMRPRTRVPDVVARMLCFYYALMAYNEWVLLRYVITSLDNSGRKKQCVMTQTVFKLGVQTASILEPKPPT